MSKKQDSNSFNAKLKRLDDISQALEDETVDINKSIELFEEGVNLVNECMKILNEAELKITTLKSGMKLNQTPDDDTEEEI